MALSLDVDVQALECLLLFLQSVLVADIELRL